MSKEATPARWKLQKTREGQASQIWGGLDTATLARWVKEGRVGPRDKVAEEGTSLWVAASEVAELQEVWEQLRPREPIETALPPMEEEGEEESPIELAPMIDVTFQLLIFFMLTANIATQAALNVPKAKMGEGVSPDNKIIVCVSKEEAIYMNDNEKDVVSLAELPDRLRRAALDKGSVDLIIKADGDVHSGLVTKIMSVASGVNIGQIRIGVREDENL